MQIKLNGKETAVKDGLNVSLLLQELKLDPVRVAVEVNFKVIKKEDYSRSLIKEGDAVEIVTLMGGGKEKVIKSLVIVESPAKAGTINKFLGKEYKVCASMGHVIDLPKSKMGVDIENNFTPQYVVIAQKRKVLSQLKKEAKGVENIYLATDPDREGEAIGWHLAQKLQDGKTVQRVTFNEITRRAVENAFKHPCEIDLNKVNAQQARRVLDRIVGYNLSPLLWKKVGRGLSAGRVQSVAVRLIVEREEEINAFKKQEYWEITAELKKVTVPDTSAFIARLDRIDGKKAEIHNQVEAEGLSTELKRENFIVYSVEKKERKRNPQPPFTTSKLQQEAFNRLRFSAARTMRLAQQLYEGLEIGEEGSVGLITYMRTDSVRIADEAQEEAKEYVLKKYGTDFYPPQPNRYKSRKESQGAHEAVRPTSAFREPETLRKYLTPDLFKLYKLIWERFVSSQMTPARFLLTAADIKAGRCDFRANGLECLFSGYRIVYEEGRDLSRGYALPSAEGRALSEKEKEEEGEEKKLPPLEKDEPLNLIMLDPTQHWTEPPPRYTEASLVKALEEKGIGRPSTYAPIIQTIILRDYVARQGGSLSPTELGITVNSLLIQYFPQVLDVEFTARMEDELDGIEEGKMEWVKVLKEFYEPFQKSLLVAQEEMKSLRREVTQIDEKCPTCGQNLVIKWGRYGKFIACSTPYPQCKYARAITSGVKCPAENCGGELVARRSKRGRFFGCSNYPACKYVSRNLPAEKNALQNEGDVVE